MRLRNCKLKSVILLSLMMPIVPVQAQYSLNGDTYLCYGPTASQQNLSLTSSTAANVYINSTFVNSSAVTGHAIYARSDSSVGDVTLIQESDSKIQGTLGGITLYSSGTGSTDVAINGDVASTITNGNYSHAVWVYNYSAATDLIITQTSGSTVTGADCGIVSYNYGSGSTTDMIAGTVKGTRYYGVYAANGYNGVPAGTNVTVNQTAGTITGNVVGIYAKNNGSGMTSVNVEGMVSGGTAGVYAGNGSLTTSLDITQGTGSSIIGGAYGGVYTWSSGSGAINLDLAGIVTGNRGIYAENTGSSGVITIDQTAGSITGTAGAAIETFGTTVNVNTINAYGTTDGLYAYDNGNGLIINQSGSITGNSNGIEAQNSGSGSTVISIAGAVTGETGAGILTDENSGVAVTTDIKNGAAVTGSTNAILDTDGDASIILESGSTTSGAVRLGNGSDTLTVMGTANIGETSAVLDGGNSTDSNVTDILGTSAAATNKLTFQGTTQSLAGSVMKNWQTVTLDSSKVTFAGDAALVTGTGTNGDGSLQGLVLQNASTLSSPVELAVTGDANIDGTSVLQHDLGGGITGDVTNAGMIYWGTIGNTLTVNGNYKGIAGSQISLATYLADDSSATDRLNITGNTNGTTAIAVRPASGSPGAQTTEGIQVVHVTGTSDGVFTLASPVQAGAYEYQLFKNGLTEEDGDWYLRSKKTLPIYRPGTANYVASQAANEEQGFADLSTMHQRISEQRGTTTDDKEIWAKTYYDKDDNQGGRFGYNQHINGIQVGYEGDRKTLADGTQERSGIELHYSRSSATFCDKERPLVDLKEQTGKMNSDSAGIGGYFTRMKPNGEYLDLVGQVSRLHNKFQDSYAEKATQNGWRFGLSAETGKALDQKNGWVIEPQVQLSYLNTSYNGFSDSISNVAGYHGDALRGRLGVRFYNYPVNEESDKYYGIVNVVHDFLDQEEVTIGETSLKESFDKTYWEVGAGLQKKLNKSKKGSWLYGDARYKHSFGGNKHGYVLNVGFKWEF